MNKANDITEELKELQSVLAEMPRTMPYAVPQGYFGMLEESVRAGLFATDDYKLAIEDKQVPYEVPNGYFETLPGVVLETAQAKGISFTDDKAQPFAVPEGYFDKLPMQMLHAAQQADTPKASKTIPLGRLIWKNTRWVAAALLILGIGVGSYNILNPNTINTEQKLAQIPNSTINDYVQNHIDEFDADMIAANTTTPNATQPTTEELGEDEIVDYLNETGWESTTTN